MVNNNSMDLAQALCRKAHRIHGWDVSFSGSVRSSAYIQVGNWVASSESPQISIGKEVVNGIRTYGFVDENERDSLVYQPFVYLYSGREHDYQIELLSAMLLILRHEIPVARACIYIPNSLERFVGYDHLQLLERDDPRVKKFLRNGPIPIYREGLEGMIEVVASIKKWSETELRREEARMFGEPSDLV